MKTRLHFRLLFGFLLLFSFIGFSQDTDGDGVIDSQELIDQTDPNDPCDYFVQSVTVQNTAGLDCDGDGVLDVDEIVDGTDPQDFCDFDPYNVTVFPSVQWLTADCDGDEIDNGTEAGIDPINPKDTDGDNTPDYFDEDSDDDGVPDATEADTDGDPTNGPDDTDGDNIPDYQDIDDDNDGILTENESSGDTDGDDLPDYLDQDSDDDGIPDNVEGQSTLNYIQPTGLDSDSDGLDEAYDDSDGLTNSDGIVPEDTDDDGDDDYVDEDSDNDGVFDDIEGHDFNHDGISDITSSFSDINNNGIGDAFEDNVFPGTFYGDPNGIIDDPIIDMPNNDAEDDVDYRDPDDDNDGLPTENEDANNNGNYADDDDDNDGTPDYLDDDTTIISVIDSELSTIQFYPNPTKNTLTIELIDTQLNVNYAIYSLTGSIVYKKQTLEQNKTEINISNLSAGVYFIKLENDNQTAIRKFVKK